MEQENKIEKWWGHEKNVKKKGEDTKEREQERGDKNNKKEKN